MSLCLIVYSALQTIFLTVLIQCFINRTATTLLNDACLFICFPLRQGSAASAFVTRSAAPTAACALPTEPTATYACVRWASGELCARRVSGFYLLQPLLRRNAEKYNRLQSNSFFFYTPLTNTVKVSACSLHVAAKCSEYICSSDCFSPLGRFLAVLAALQRDSVLVRRHPLAAVVSQLLVLHRVRGDVSPVHA